ERQVVDSLPLVPFSCCSQISSDGRTVASFLLLAKLRAAFSFSSSMPSSKLATRSLVLRRDTLLWLSGSFRTHALFSARADCLEALAYVHSCSVAQSVALHTAPNTHADLRSGREFTLRPEALFGVPETNQVEELYAVVIVSAQRFKKGGNAAKTAVIAQASCREREEIAE